MEGGLFCFLLLCLFVCLDFTHHLVNQTSRPKDVRSFDSRHTLCNVMTFLVFLIMFSFYCGLFHVSVMIFCQYIPEYGQPASVGPSCVM